jgi:hypothetical protein
MAHQVRNCPRGGRGKDGTRRGAVESWDNSRVQLRAELDMSFLWPVRRIGEWGDVDELS